MHHIYLTDSSNHITEHTVETYSKFTATETSINPSPVLTTALQKQILLKKEKKWTTDKLMTAVIRQSRDRRLQATDLCTYVSWVKTGWQTAVKMLWELQLFKCETERMQTKRSNMDPGCFLSCLLFSFLSNQCLFTGIGLWLSQHTADVIPLIITENPSLIKQQQNLVKQST